MESIDVHDLPEGEAQLIAQLVELLRHRRHGAEPEVKRVDELEDTVGGEPPFAIWPLGVKGTLSREDIYDHL